MASGQVDYQKDFLRLALGNNIRAYKEVSVRTNTDAAVTVWMFVTGVCIALSFAMAGNAVMTSMLVQ